MNQPHDIQQWGPAWSGEVQTARLKEVTLQVGTERKLEADRRKEQHVKRP